MIKGKYVFRSNGEIIAEKENTLTASGIYVINSFLGDSGKNWAGTIAIGALYTATASTDINLAYETTRVRTTSKTYNPNTNSIVVKATIPEGFIGSIYEIGIIPSDWAGLDKKNYEISDFSETYTSGSSKWKIGPTPATANTYSTTLSSISRLGNKSIAVNTSSVAYLPYLKTIDLSSYNFWTGDNLDLLFYVPTSAVGTNTPSVKFIIKDSEGLSWTSSLVPILSTSTFTASGYYNVLSPMLVQSASFGSSEIQSITASFAGGTASIVLDALFFRDSATQNAYSSLLSRTSSSAAIVSISSKQPLEIDYYLTVT